MNANLPGGLLLALITSALIACGGGGDGGGDGGTDGSPADAATDAAADTTPPVACEADGDCDDGRFCNGVEACGAGRCAAGSAPCGAGESCDEAEARCDAVGPGGDGLPVGIPAPSFSCEHDGSLEATIYVDGGDAACDDAGPGSASTPLCSLFRDGRSGTYEAGAVIHVLGGPYAVSGDLTLTMNGTADAPVFVIGQGAERVLLDGQGERVEFEWSGSYGCVEHLDFFHKTRHRVSGDHLGLRDVAVHNPAGAFIDFNPVVSITGHDVLIAESEIFNNRRMGDTDSHGIQASEGSYNVWILDNELYNNNGDSFQACHHCFDEPPHHVYLGRNVMHDDRENGIDLKTIHDVVISENVLFGYGASGTSNGDAMVIGSNGFDDATNQGPRRVWVLHNEIRGSGTGIRVEGSEDVWLIGNVITNVGVGLQIDNKSHRDIVVAANTLRAIVSGDGVSVFGCEPDTLTLIDNIVFDVAERHLDMGECAGPALNVMNNVLANVDGTMAARVDGTQHTDIASLNGRALATANLAVDPMFEDATLVPSATSVVVDAGASLEPYYQAFRDAFGLDISLDRAGTARPSGEAEDIGAFERP